MNQVFLSGKVGQDAKSGTTQKGTQWANVSLATSKKVKEEWVSTWHRVVAWGKQASKLAQAKKGDKLFVTGEIQNGSYEKDGVKKYTTDIIAREVFVSANDSGYDQSQAGDNFNQEVAGDDGGELPF